MNYIGWAWLFVIHFRPETYKSQVSCVDTDIPIRTIYTAFDAVIRIIEKVCNIFNTTWLTI